MAKLSFILTVSVLAFSTIKIGNAGVTLVHGPGYYGDNRAYYGDNRAYYGDSRGYNYGGYGYYRRGHHFRHGPQVIITVPPIPFYLPGCHEVEVCNGFGQCWLENSCD